MTDWVFPVHPVKETENTNTINVVVDICQFDDKVAICLFPIILTSNALSFVSMNSTPSTTCYYTANRAALRGRWNLVA